MEQISLYKERSYAACISEGFKFFARNLKLFAKVMLPYCFICALLSLVANMIILRYAFIAQSGQVLNWKDSVTLLLTILFTGLVCIAVYLFANGRLFLALRRLTGVEESISEQKISKWSFKFPTKDLQLTWKLTVRSLPFTVILPVALIVCYGIFYALLATLLEILKAPQVIAASILLLVLVISLIIVLIAVSPLMYSYYYHMMQPETPKLSKIKETYKKGSRHLWKILGVGLLTTFITLVLTILLRLPEMILTQAYIQSQTDNIMMGDTTMIPMQSIILLSFISSVASAFVLLISIPENIVNLYLYGDIETREK